jgi:hypothetical protein
MQQLFDSIPKVFRELDNTGKVTEAFALAAWKKVVGTQLSERSRAVSLQNKRLNVTVAGDEWQKQLESLSPLLISKLNQLIGDGSVTFIEFMVDGASFEEVIVRENIEEELSVSSSLAQAASAIADEDLRHQFLVAAASCLKRQK